MDNEILAVENRIREREVKVKLLAGMTGRRAMKALASPASLIGVAAIGFLAGGGLRGRRGHQQSDATAKKAVGVGGLLMTAAMWFIKARFGTPWAAAEWALAKFQHRAPHPQAQKSRREATARQ
ncbi:MAG TPA: hypothetical protein VEC14_16475 [Reyranellaceae bacterium]|nr:hypothetical protein [Reyranellaceae bacterium]